MPDAVNPAHYRAAAGFQVIDVIEAFKLNFCLGNVIKYVCRSEQKAGLEDLKKAAWYLKREIERLEKEQAASKPASPVPSSPPRGVFPIPWVQT